MPEFKEKEKILILGIDRDDDIGLKTSFKGPIVGRGPVLETAIALGLSDPEDTDFNALFQTLKVYDELKKLHHAEIAILTGDRNVGIKSDKHIANQIESVLSKFKADYAVIVSDGSEDEHVIPIIQSKIPILSVNRVVVKQSELLESGYYKIKDFIKESLETPRIARLIFGIPSIILLMLALFGVEGWRAVIGVLGVYLFIKGFKLEDLVLGGIDELKTSFTRRRFGFFMYIVAFTFFALATYRGYLSYLDYQTLSLFEQAAGFVSTSIFLYYISSGFAWIGKNVKRPEKRRGRKVVAILIFGFAITLMLFNTALLIISTDFPLINYLIAIIVGFFLLFAALMLEWKT